MCTHFCSIFTPTWVLCCVWKTFLFELTIWLILLYAKIDPKVGKKSQRNKFRANMVFVVCAVYVLLIARFDPKLQLLTMNSIIGVRKHALAWYEVLANALPRSYYLKHLVKNKSLVVDWNPKCVGEEKVMTSRAGYHALLYSEFRFNIILWTPAKEWRMKLGFPPVTSSLHSIQILYAVQLAGLVRMVRRTWQCTCPLLFGPHPVVALLPRRISCLACIYWSLGRWPLPVHLFWFLLMNFNSVLPLVFITFKLDYGMGLSKVFLDIKL